MDAQPDVILRCEQCGHEWTPRNTIGTSRQCSKCRSKQIVEVTDEDGVQDSQSVATASPSPRPYVNPIAASSRSNALKDDPEVRQKLKELEIARLEKEIRALKSPVQDAAALDRMALNLWAMLDAMKDRSTLTDSMYQSIRTQCAWCGAEGDSGFEYFEDKGDGEIKTGYRCRSCNHIVKLE